MHDKDEAYVLSKIKQHAVIAENIVLARVTHLQMRQDREEGVRNYAAKLKGQASSCNYTIKHKCSNCAHEEYVNYDDEMVRNVLASGLADSEIQIDLLGNADQEMPLDQMIKFIEAKEVGKKSASCLTGTQKVSAVRSTYKRDATKSNNQRDATHATRLNIQRDFSHHTRSNSQNFKGNIRNKGKDLYCGWCGKYGHGNNIDIDHRRKVCPAFNQKCKYCDRWNHHESMCRTKISKGKSNTSAINEDTYSDSDDQVGAIRQ